MLEIIQYMTSDFFVWLGCMILIAAVGSAFEQVVTVVITALRK